MVERLIKSNANNQKKIADTAFDRSVFRAVASVSGGSEVYKKIMTDIKKQLGPKMPSKFIKGTSEPTPEEARFIVSVLVVYDPTITVHDLIDP